MMEASGGFYPLGSLLLLVVIVPVVVLMTVVPFWFICRKAGFPGALSLLMIVPVGNIVLPFVLAFAEWPALRKNPEDV